MTKNRRYNYIVYESGTLYVYMFLACEDTSDCDESHEVCSWPGYTYATCGRAFDCPVRIQKIVVFGKRQSIRDT